MKYKIIYISFILFFSLNFLMGAPEWIPSWERPMSALLTGSLLVMLIEGFIIIIHIRNYVNANDLPAFYKAVAMIGVPLLWLVNVFICSLSFGQGLFASQHFQTYEYPTYSTNIYIYDSGFLDPSATVKIKNGFLPVMSDLHTFAIKPEDVSVIKNGKIVSISDGDYVLEYNLETKLLRK